jgi:predicted hydrocarbon binding protein
MEKQKTNKRRSLKYKFNYIQSVNENGSEEIMYKNGKRWKKMLITKGEKRGGQSQNILRIIESYQVVRC